ncbi:MAG TPA: YkgJ family cysteine cluster protein [Pseudomonadales bacterium]|nr:YkgJ family cysteine cluster protein [Gammaproteobacteria bacterium]HIM34233.1 YkgJ family cysteine cluster protein [Pseudomonadales bacterium]
MDCRVGCGACCIAPSINIPMPGMPHGKPAGVRCLHLSEDRRCRLYESPERPDICRRFAPELAFCGTNFDDAIEKFSVLELETRPIG